MKEELLQLWHVVLVELGTRCDCAINTTLDWETVQRRSTHEGESFLTISLPAFGKDFEKSLDQGGISTDLFRGWVKFPSKESGPLVPRFLSGFVTRVFDRRTGRLLDEPDPEAVLAVRQLTLMCGKVLIPCSDARYKAAMDRFVECEQEIRTSDAQMPIHLLDEFRDASSVLYAGVMQQVDEDVYYGRIIPKHGPGATADRIKGNLKFEQTEWTNRLDRVFPFGEFLASNPRYHFDVLSRVNFLEPGAERPVRVVAVPKTLKTPRIIAIEPVCMQYVQQGLMDRFVTYLESEVIQTTKGVPVHNSGYGYVGFSDQKPNQLMAREGSLTGALATLDLSEASDRVSNQLVRVMFERFPNLAEGVDACRSRKADVDGHGVIRLAKFASMGSALTFPIEAMVFSTIVMMGVAKVLNKPVDRELCEEFRGQVRVYGDDIIVPKAYAVSVSQLLEAFGFRVNRGKSFWTGEFRESCGKEYFRGHDVSVVRVRRALPTALTHEAEIISTVSLRNQFYQLGLWETTKWLDRRLDKVLKGLYPTVAETSQVLGRVSVLGYETHSMCPKLHAPLVRGYVVDEVIPDSEINDHAALLKCLLKQSEEPFADAKHLLRGGRPVAVNIKLRKASPF
jgi:hypothetical protein